MTDTTQFAAGTSGAAALSGIITQDGTHTCLVHYLDASGNASPDAGPTEAVTRLNGNFTVTATVPDAPGNPRFK